MIAVPLFKLYDRGIYTGKLKIYNINSLKDRAKHECNKIIIVPRMHKHPTSGANTPSDIAVTVNINAQVNLSLVR
jgi:hypothetical protein